MDRCPRCSRPVFNDRGEMHCLSCGELTHPDILVRSAANAAEDAEMANARRVAKKRQLREAFHLSNSNTLAEADDMADLAAEFSDIPAEAWDQVCSAMPAWKGPGAMRESLERARHDIAVGRFRYYSDEGVATIVRPDVEPTDPVDWIGWRLRHGMAISADILERELRLNWRQAADALAKWRQRVESEAAG